MTDPRPSGLGRPAARARREGVGAVVAAAAVATALLLAQGVATGAAIGHETVDSIGTWWFQWWVADTVATDASLLHTDRLFFPFGKDVLAHTGANVLDALLVAPLRGPLGPVVAWNILVGAIIASNAVTAGLVARRAGIWFGVVGAALGALHPVALHELGQGRPTQAILAPLIAALVVGDAGLRRGGIDRLLAAGVLLGLQGWFYWFSGLFGALAILVLGGATMVGSARAPGGRGAAGVVLGRLVLVLATAATVAAPVAGPLALATATGDAAGLLDVSRWWTDGAVVTREGDAVNLTILGGWGQAGVVNRAGFDADGPVLGLVVLGLAFAAPWRWRLVALLALILAVGPTVAGVPNPVYISLTVICPPLARLWWPVRTLSLLVPVAVIGLSALGSRGAGQRWNGFLAAVLTVALAIEATGRGLVPLGTWRPAIPAGLAVLASAPRGAAVVLPWGYDQRPLLYQAGTGAPLLNGMYERTAAFVPAEMQALQRDNTFLAALLLAPRDPRADPAIAEGDHGRFVALGYRWVVLRRDALGPVDGPRSRGALRRLRDLLGVPKVDDPEVIVWELSAEVAAD